MATQKSPTLVKTPVVTIMGHVDHGKTTLLDKIRQSNIAAREEGGITQGIGAYQIVHNNQPITFIDTPGHAAFSKMRSHGASITDIVVLVVAADDGLKPQTKESIEHIKKSQVPVIVAINKIDLKAASPEMVKAQLTEEQIFVEGYGGSVPVVEISALTGKNIDKLLETILLLAELEGVAMDPQAPLKAVVIESSLNKNQGPIATLLVKAGTLNRGDSLVSFGIEPQILGKAKLLQNDLGKPLSVAGPSTPIRLLGLKSVPPVGSVFSTPEGAQGFQIVEAEHPVPAVIAPAQPPAVIPTTSTEEKVQTIKLILKTDTVGSLEAIQNSLTEEVEFISASTGEVIENDIMLAHTTGAAVIAFRVPISRSAKKLADIEQVAVKSYTLIYKLLEDFEQQILKLLEPTIDEIELGVAEILALFDIKNTQILGCKVKSGILTLGDVVHLKRETKILTDARIGSLKQGKIDASSIDAGNECGLVLKPAIKVQVGDKLVAYKKKS